MNAPKQFKVPYTTVTTLTVHIIPITLNVHKQFNVMLHPIPTTLHPTPTTVNVPSLMYPSPHAYHLNVIPLPTTVNVPKNLKYLKPQLPL